MKGLHHAIDDPDLRSTVTSASVPTLSIAAINALMDGIEREARKQNDGVAEIAFHSVKELEYFRRLFPSFTAEAVDLAGIQVGFHPFMGYSMAFLDKDGVIIRSFEFRKT